MSNINRKGPNEVGSKTGRKLGICKKSDSEQAEASELGKGQAKKRHSGGGKGKGKRLKYNQ